MQTFGNRQVFVIGILEPDGIQAAMLWLKTDDLVGTDQQIYDRNTNHSVGYLSIPKDATSVHLDILLPYASSTALENPAQETHAQQQRH